MRQALKLTVGCLMASLLFIQCGSNGSQRTINEYLGAVPSIEKEYAIQWQELTEERKAATTLEESERLRVQLESLRTQWTESIENHLRENPLTKPLPFQALENTPYTIREIKIVAVTRGKIELVFDVALTEDILEENPFSWGGGPSHRPVTTLGIYFKALDSQGNDIPYSLTPAIQSGREPLNAGTNWKINASWNRRAIIHLEDFAKIKEITREEYQGKTGIL